MNGKNCSSRLGMAGLAIIVATSTAAAAIVTETFTGTVLDGPFAGTIGTGSFSYDDASITGSGSESIGPTDGLTVTFTIFGQTFDETNDIDYDAFPLLDFLDGVPTFLDYIVNETHPINPTAINQAGVIGFATGELTRSQSGGFETVVSVAVPEPSGMAFAAAAGLGLGAFVIQRRRTLQKRR